MPRVSAIGQNHGDLSETHRVGNRTREAIVRAEECPALRWHAIRHVGIADAAVPYRMVRTNLSGAYLLACFGGEGRILLDGRWRACGKNTACLAPPHALHAFHCVPRTRWEFCWVRYAHPDDQQRLFSASAPVLAAFDGLPLRAAIQGLHAEMASAQDPLAIQHWVELIQRYVQRFCQPWHIGNPLGAVWEAVDRDLGHGWNVKELCTMAHCSDEQLRRLCHRHLGRSPMHQVTYLRMRQAAVLLERTEEKIQSIAAQVGYESAFTFTNTFKRWIGWSPSAYRGHRQQQGAGKH